MLCERRVVITGLGVISSLGMGWQEWWGNIMAGTSGITQITAFDSSGYETHVAGEVRNFNSSKFHNNTNIRKLGKASQFAIAASRLALEDAGFKIRKSRHTKIGVVVGTTMGEIQVLENLDDSKLPMNNFDVDRISAVQYSAAGISFNVGKFLKLNGPNITCANACAAGNYALSLAFEYIRNGRVDFMLAGGSDAFSRIAYTGFARLYAVAPEKCQPFDKNRQGMIPGEGAGILFLESFESAVRRKATIYAEVKAYGLSCDASHMTHPDVVGITKAIKKSLDTARVNLNDITYISAHGTGTKENDKAECKAFREIFGKNLDYVPVSSIKSMLGHAMGAASAFESVGCCLSVHRDEIPPTINFNVKDSDCDIDCVPIAGRKHKNKIVLNNSQAFGGNNSVLLFQKVSL